VDKSKKIVVGADHFGMPLKNVVRDHLLALGYQIDDMGVNSDDPVDYPDVGASLAEAVAAGEYERGARVPVWPSSPIRCLACAPYA
jgi:ribose 5-phosphate isomerase B